MNKEYIKPSMIVVEFRYNILAGSPGVNDEQGDGSIRSREEFINFIGSENE